MANLFEAIPEGLPEELFEEIVSGRGATVERIVSPGPPRTRRPSGWRCTTTEAGSGKGQCHTLARMARCTGSRPCA